MNNDELTLKNKGLGGTNFLVTIHHQENLNWQGVIQWLDTGKKVHFKSTLELMNLINEAVCIQNKGTDTLRSWSDDAHVKAI